MSYIFFGLVGALDPCMVRKSSSICSCESDVEKFGGFSFFSVLLVIGFSGDSCFFSDIFVSGVSSAEEFLDPSFPFIPSFGCCHFCFFFYCSLNFFFFFNCFFRFLLLFSYVSSLLLILFLCVSDL